MGSEWRTFSNDKSSADRSRVGAAEVNHPSLPSRIRVHTSSSHSKCYTAIHVPALVSLAPFLPSSMHVSKVVGIRVHVYARVTLII